MFLDSPIWGRAAKMQARAAAAALATKSRGAREARPPARRWHRHCSIPSQDGSMPVLDGLGPGVDELATNDVAVSTPDRRKRNCVLKRLKEKIMKTNKGMSALVGAVLIGVAALASAGDSTTENVANDFRSVSNAYLQLAVAYGRQDDSSAACAALAKSLDYYRKAVAKDDVSADLGDRASDGIEWSDGMQAVGAKVGCRGRWATAAL
jgi:hypothetical protein